MVWALVSSLAEAGVHPKNSHSGCILLCLRVFVRACPAGVCLSAGSLCSRQGLGRKHPTLHVPSRVGQRHPGGHRAHSQAAAGIDKSDTWGAQG
jgi:hypothetical protein